MTSYTKEQHDNEHDSKTSPVLGCSYCDKEIHRPIPLCYGDGKSSVVIPIMEEKGE